MVSQKIKFIRELLGLTEIQVSNIIYMNSYKYKKSENNSAYISTEKLLLLSMIYKIPLDKLLLDKYSIEEVLQNDYLKYLKEFDKEHIEMMLKDNLCSCFIPKREKFNYTTIDLILRNKLKSFGIKLKSLRQDKQIEIFTVVNISGLQVSEYKSFESGFSFPNLKQLVCLSEVFEITINDLMGI